MKINKYTILISFVVVFSLAILISASASGIRNKNKMKKLQGDYIPSATGTPVSAHVEVTQNVQTAITSNGSQTGPKPGVNCIQRPQPQPEIKCIPRPKPQPDIKCIPRPAPLPKPEIKCIPRPVPLPKPEVPETPVTVPSLPYCDEIPTPAPEVPVTIPNLPYCDEPVAIIPPVVNVPNIIPCKMLDNCCWWGYKILPESFWVKQDLTKGQDFIVIGNNGNYLSSDNAGNVRISQTAGNNELWQVIKSSENLIYLLNFHGGYLAIHEDGTVDALSRVKCDDNIFDVLHSDNNCSADGINYAAFRAINGKYLSFYGGNPKGVEKVKDQTEIFKGYLFDNASSQCSGGAVPSVAPVAPVAPVPSLPPVNPTIETIPVTLPANAETKDGKVVSLECKVTDIHDKSEENAVQLKRYKKNK